MPLITLPNTAKPPFGPKSKPELSLTLIENWLVALSGPLVQTIAMVRRVLLRPFLASFRIGGPVLRSLRSVPSQPPWIKRPGTTRWKIVPR